MLRLPSFTYLQPRTLHEALAMKTDAGPDGMYVAGGTDLYPNMKRRHQEPRTVISLMGIPALAGCEMRDGGCVPGPCLTLSELSANPPGRRSAPAVGERVGPAARVYHNDGINYLTKQPDEVLCEVRLPRPDGWDAVYHKLRRRDSFDFPVLGVAAWVRWEEGRGTRDEGRVAEARIVLGGVASWPQEVPEAGAALVGTDLADEGVAAAADAAYRPAKPMDNTDFDLSWRKQMTRVYVSRGLAELRRRRHPPAR